MSSSFKDELLLMITEQDSPVIRTDWLTLKLNVKKEKVAKALLELKQEGEIFFIIQPDGDLYLTHINGKEIKWKVEALDEKKEFKDLFDLEGNLKTDPLGFYDTISQLPSVSQKENTKLFNELILLQEKNDEEYKEKVLEISNKNIRLIRQKVFEVIDSEDLYDYDLEILYKNIISTFCQAVQKFPDTSYFESGNGFEPYAQWRIHNSIYRARSYIIQQRLDSGWGFTLSIKAIEDKIGEMKRQLLRNPTFDEIEAELEPLVEEKWEKNQELEELKEEQHFQRIGLNKLFTELVNSDITIEPSYEDKLRLNSAIENLDKREIDVINKRFGLHDEKYEYGMTLEEIGIDYNVSRERIRQIVVDAIEKIRYYFKNEDLEEDAIPLVFFPKNVQSFLKKNNITYFSDIFDKTKQDILNLPESTEAITNKLIEVLESLGVQVETVRKGEINFDQLSVRARNALRNMNILFEKEILKLTEYDLKSIPNLGVKTTNELLSYIKRLQTNQKEEFSPEKVILFPCANPISQRNFEKTMRNSYKLDTVKDYLLVNQYNDLKNIGEEFYFWGTKSGTDKKWQQIPNKSLALFFANKFAFSYGFVEYKLINQPLSDYFWGRDEQADKSYKYMFACSEVKETSIPQWAINETIGYKEGFVVQGFMVLNNKQSFDLLNLVNKYKFD